MMVHLYPMMMLMMMMLYLYVMLMHHPTGWLYTTAQGLP